MEHLLKNKTPNKAHLIAYGFENMDTFYQYRTFLLNAAFQMIVTVSKEGLLTTTLLDKDTNEEYVLHQLRGSVGTFVTKVKEAHDEVLQDIVNTCFDPSIFKNACTKEIITYVQNTYQTELEFLWPKVDDNAIWRRKDTNKWFGALLLVSKQKLGIDSDEIIEILDLRILPEKLNEILDHPSYYPGFHMNKKHWYTVLLDGSVPVNELCKRIDESFQLAQK